MKPKYELALVALILLSSSVFADLIISYPRIALKDLRKVQVGSSPSIIIKYKNSTGSEVKISAVGIYLQYNPLNIDNIIDIKNEYPDNFFEKEKDLSSSGMVVYKFVVSGSNPNPLVVKAGETRNLATIIFHVNQEALPQSKTINLFDFGSDTAGAGGCRVFDGTEDITGSGLINSPVLLEKSAPPYFSGLSKVSPNSAAGINNIGNTLLLDWVTPGTGGSGTKYTNGKLSYRVYRSSSPDLSNPVELSTEPEHSPENDPANHLPYTGNLSLKDYVYQDGPGSGAPSDSDPLSDGTTYYYKVVAVDDCSPNPNVNSNTAVMPGTPVDLNPPGKVLDLSAKAEDGRVVLSWTNPADPDLGGVLIMRNSEKPIGVGELRGASYPDKHGTVYNYGDEPFGTGNGTVIYVSPQEDYGGPSVVQTQFEDYTDNGMLNYYRVFTYDRAIDGPPREMGLNYSKGVDISKAAGRAPQDISNFVVSKGPAAGEIVFTWTNSPDDFCEGVVIRYTSNDKLKFAALTNENSGDFAGIFPVTSGPDAPEAYSLIFPPGVTYYFKAFAYNRTYYGLDPADPISMGMHAFSNGQNAALKLLLEKGEELYAYNYGFQKGINHFAVPFPAMRVTDATGELIDVSTWEKLIDELNKQAGGNVVLTFGHWNEITQKAEGILDIDYSKVGADRFTATAGVTPSQPVLQGGAYEITVSRPLTFTIKTARTQ